jgi:UDP-N-acetylenolpyruvoylglucosamine reductase
MNMSEPAQFLPALRGVLRENVAMHKHTSWRAGGQVARMYQPADLADLQVFLRRLPASEPVMAVGLGSNLLVREGGWCGTVLLIHAALNELQMEGDLLYAQAGIAGAKLARFAALHHLAGTEFFAGIPGTVGGMLAMNAGCYGSETWGKVARVQVLTRNGTLLERAADEYVVGYRSVGGIQDGEIFAGAWFKLDAGDGEISRQAIKSLLSKRIASQPLNLPNAGSVFRNPAGDHAARLIESCGLKGKQIGAAQVSEKHANFIVNLGGATATDIECLINEIRSTVQQKTGVDLHPEVRIVGEHENHG